MHKQYLEELVLNKHLISRIILSFSTHRLLLYPLTWPSLQIPCTQCLFLMLFYFDLTLQLGELQPLGPEENVLGDSRK